MTLTLQGNGTLNGLTVLGAPVTTLANTGTAASPSLVFDGDSDTGLFRPGANQLALSVGGSARLTIASDGTTTFTNLETSAGSLTFGNYSSTTASSAKIWNNNSYGLYINGTGDSTHSAFGVYKVDGTAGYKARIFHDGSATFEAGVNVRTQDAARGLTINSSSSSQNEALKINANGGAQVILFKHDGSASFGSGNQFDLASYGALSIMRTDNQPYPLFRWGTTDSYTGGGIYPDGSATFKGQTEIGTYGANLGGGVRLYKEGAVFITTDQDSAASRHFKVTDTSGTDVISFYNDGGAQFLQRCDFGSSSIADVAGKFSNSDASSATLYITNHNASGDVFSGRNTSNAEVARIGVDGSATFAGKLLVNLTTARTNYFNTTAYGSLVNFEGTANSNRIVSFVHNDNSGGPMLVLGATGGSASGSNNLVSNSVTYGIFSFQGSDGTDLVEAARISAEADGTPAANDMPGAIVFSTTSDGNDSVDRRMVITGDGYLRLHTNSPGIQFNNDTAAANALDDYEEGSWTPTGNNNFNNITNAEGYYTKVGKIVTLNFQFNYGSLDDSATYSAVAGVPFQPGDYNSNTGVEATNCIFGTNKLVLIYVNSNSNNLFFETSRPLAGSAGTGADFFRGSITYLT